MSKSKTFDAIKFEMAMFPYPLFMAAIELRASGTERPAATKVRRLTTSGMPSVLQIIVISQTFLVDKFKCHHNVESEDVPCYLPSSKRKTISKSQKSEM